MVIRAYLANPIPGEFPAAHSGHKENLVSATPQSLRYGGRNIQFEFEIKLDLARPGEILIEDEPLEREGLPLAA